jgi:hypothetical protein
MEAFVRRFPEEIEDKIREYVLSDSVKFELLLDKYPLTNDLFNGFTNKQLSNLYRFSCVCNILPWIYGYLSCSILAKVEKLFPKHDCANDSSVWSFAQQCSPTSEMNLYWQYGQKKYDPSREEVIDGIIKFCKVMIEFPRKHNNKLLRQYCDKIVHDMIICVLIIRRKNLVE